MGDDVSSPSTSNSNVAAQGERRLCQLDRLSGRALRAGADDPYGPQRSAPVVRAFELYPEVIVGESGQQTRATVPVFDQHLDGLAHVGLGKGQSEPVRKPDQL